MKKKYLIIILAFIILVTGILVILYGTDLINNNGEENIVLISKPILNYFNNEEIDCEDIEIKWEPCTNAEKYMYKAIILEGEPDVNNNNEAALPGSILICENTIGSPELSFKISEGQLINEKWLKIAVAACNGENSTWSLIYLFIKG